MHKDAEYFGITRGCQCANDETSRKLKTRGRLLNRGGYWAVPPSAECLGWALNEKGENVEYIVVFGEKKKITSHTCPLPLRFDGPQGGLFVG